MSSIIFCREVRIPSVQKEVERRTRNSSRTKHGKDMAQKAATASNAAASGTQIETKDLHIEIPHAEIREARKAMKPQTARRGRVRAGPVNNGKTLREFKNVQPEQVQNITDQDRGNIIEDCHVTTDNTSYGDWLIEQGIISPVKISNNDDNLTVDDNNKEQVNVEPTKPTVEPQQTTSDEIRKIVDTAVTPDSSDSLNELMTKLNQYLGPHTVPDCEKKIGKLKEILNILDNDAKENPSTNTQIDANTMKPKDIDKEKDDAKKEKQDEDKQRNDIKDTPDKPKVKDEDTQKPKEEEKTNKDVNEKPERYVKDNEKDKVTVADPSDMKAPEPDKTESELKKEKEDELNNNTVQKQNDDQGKHDKSDTENKIEPDVDRDLDRDNKVEPVDLTTHPNAKETKSVTFKTPDEIAFRQEQDKLFEEKIQAMECKNNCAANVSDENVDESNMDGHDTDEIDDDDDSDEIPCSQMKRIPRIWNKLDKETGEEHDATKSELSQDDGESQEESNSQEEDESQEEGESQKEGESQAGDESQVEAESQEEGDTDW